jgi:predicted O-linked N-acetylglucosamine transferase (SPINDLY family)
MPTIAEILTMGLDHHRAGRLDRAELIYRKILEFDPAQPDALHLLGTLALQRGQGADAVQFLTRAVQANGAQPGYHLALGDALQGQGQPAQAMAAFACAAELAPDNAEAAYKLGTAAMLCGEAERAAASLSRAAAIDGGFVEALLYLGVVELSRDRPAAAVAALERARAALGDEAARPALAVQVGVNLGRAYEALGRMAEAAHSFGRAREFEPQNADIAFLQGNALLAAGQPSAAADAFAHAAELQPEMVQAWYNLGTVRLNQARLGEAARHLRRAFATIPDGGAGDPKLAAIVQFNLGKALFAQGLVDAALTAYGEAVRFDPDFAKAEQTRLQVLLLRPEWDGPAIRAERGRWSRRFADPLSQAAAPHANARDPDRRLRIGYVGGEMFYGNTHARTVLPLLQAHDHGAVEVFCYSDLAEGDADAATAAYRTAADGWRIGHGRDDAALAQMIRADHIDVLIDLTGHLTGARLLSFAARPAPVQATMFATGTTGMAAFDATIADAQLVPPAHEAHFSERIQRVPLAYHYRPEPDMPPPAPPPALGRGHVTFGSFNQVAKLSGQALDAWARILLAMPAARLVLKSLGFADAEIRTRLTADLARRGIAPERLELRPWTSSSAEHQAAFGDIDIALDSFPYAGVTTTCEALWLGVPVVTLAGARLAGRFGVMLLTAAGYPEGIASGIDDYVERAVRLAGNGAALAALRQALPARIRASALTDATAYARSVEAAYRALWRSWVHADGR